MWLYFKWRGVVEADPSGMYIFMRSSFRDFKDSNKDSQNMCLYKGNYLMALCDVIFQFAVRKNPALLQELD